VASLFVLVLTAVVLRIAGWLGVRPLRSWRAVGRTSSSVMLLFTGSSHFSSMKDDFVAMLPEPVPRDVRIIYLTGLAEIAGAIGLLLPKTRRAAGIALIVQLAAMFPANVNAARKGIPLRGKPPTALWLRAPMQLLYIAVIWLTAISDRPNAAKTERIRVRR
jgi:uncharacterized membrane protein